MFVLFSVRDVVAGHYLTIVRTDTDDVYYFGYYKGASNTTPRLVLLAGLIIHLAILWLEATMVREHVEPCNWVVKPIQFRRSGM